MRSAGGLLIGLAALATASAADAGPWTQPGARGR